MRRYVERTATMILLGLLVACTPSSAPPAAPAPSPETSATAASDKDPTAADVAALNTRFDPARDPAADLAVAQADARRTGRRIVLDVGGEWCSWCHLLDAFIEGDSEIRTLRDEGFVWMKVNYSEDNENAAFLSQFPAIKGYPHLFVLDADGKLLHSQFTGELEADKGQPKGYNRERFLGFLQAWAP